MTAALVIAGAALLLGVAWLYNRFVRLRHKVREGYAGVDVQLRRRHDLVPNLVRVVQAYARHEQETLEGVVRARTEAVAADAIPDRERRESDLARSLERLLVLVERYPDLKADANFRRLHADLVEVEDDLQYARRYYNATARDFNVAREQFPSNLVAALLGLKAEPYFEVEEGLRSTVAAVRLDTP
jgi:LemA protein